MSNNFNWLSPMYIFGGVRGGGKTYALADMLNKVLGSGTIPTIDWADPPGDYIFTQPFRKTEPMRNMSLFHIQKHLSWNVPYTAAFHQSQIHEGHRHLMHDIMHMQKSLGKLAAVCEDVDHGRKPVRMVFTVHDEIVDFVICSLHLANKFNINLQEAVINKIEKVNRTTLPDECSHTDHSSEIARLKEDLLTATNERNKALAEVTSLKLNQYNQGIQISALTKEVEFYKKQVSACSAEELKDITERYKNLAVSYGHLLDTNKKLSEENYKLRKQIEDMMTMAPPEKIQIYDKGDRYILEITSDSKISQAVVPIFKHSLSVPQTMHFDEVCKK